MLRLRKTRTFTSRTVEVYETASATGALCASKTVGTINTGRGQNWMVGLAHARALERVHVSQLFYDQDNVGVTDLLSQVPGVAVLHVIDARSR